VLGHCEDAFPTNLLAITEETKCKTTTATVLQENVDTITQNKHSK